MPSLKKETAILRLLANADSLRIISRGTVLPYVGELYSAQIFDGFEVKISHSTLYVTLSAMEQNGYIASRLEPVAPRSKVVPHRLYKITPKGRQALGPGGIYVAP